MDRFIAILYEIWHKGSATSQLAAFTLWRMCWIHPFIEGNGRIVRAACYYVMCVKAGKVLTCGPRAIPARGYARIEDHMLSSIS